jgi:hypothetical protein
MAKAWQFAHNIVDIQADRRTPTFASLPAAASLQRVEHQTGTMFKEASRIKPTVPDSMIRWMALRPSTDGTQA